MSRERRSIARMTGYGYGEQPDDARVIKLNTNENPYPPSPAVKDALAAFDADVLRRYPPATAAPLRRIIAERHGVSMDEVVVTNGGDEALRLALTTFLDPGAGLGMVAPCYSLYAVLAEIHGAECIEVPLGEDWLPPSWLAEALNGEGAMLACLANPHAPSGSLMAIDAVARLAEAVDGVLLIDEAYVDFVDPELGHDLTPLIRQFDNLLLLRTLSKGYSLAGLRLGFLLGDAELIRPILTKTRDSYNIDAISQCIAEAAYRDLEHAQDTWRMVRDERARLTRELTALGFEVLPSQANFLLARVPARPGVTARGVFEALRERGILVRYFNHARTSEHLRITVGTAEENDALLGCLASILQ